MEINVGDTVTYFERGEWNQRPHRIGTGTLEQIEWIPVGNPTYIVVDAKGERKRLKRDQLTRVPTPDAARADMLRRAVEADDYDAALAGIGALE